MTPIVGRRRKRWWVIAVAVIVVVAGCADSSTADGASSSETAEDAPFSTDDPPTSVGPSDPTEPTSSTLPPSESLLSDLGAIAGAFGFTSTTTVGDVEALRIDGRRVGGATELHVSSSDALIHYVVAADGSTWVRNDGEDQWLADDPLAVGDPLAPLLDPIEVRWLVNSSVSRSYEADYEASRFGLPDGGTLTLRIEGRTGGVAYRYETVGSSVDVVITSSVDGTPIEIPVDDPAP